MMKHEGWAILEVVHALGLKRGMGEGLCVHAALWDRGHPGCILQGHWAGQGHTEEGQGDSNAPYQSAMSLIL